MNEALRRAIERQREIASTAEAEQRELNEAEQREFDNLQAVIDALNADEHREQPITAAPETPAASPTAETRNDGGYSPQTASEILSMCSTFGLRADDYIKRGLSVDEARAEILKELEKRNMPIGQPVVTHDEEDKLRAAITDGILLKAGIGVENPTPGAENFRGLTLKELAVETFEREDSNTDYRHMNGDRVYSQLARSFYNPTAAFPSILDDVVQKSYVEGLTKANTTFERWVKFGSLPNFKKTTNHEYLASYNGVLEEVPENGELKAYIPHDAIMPERQLKTYGRSFTMTREAFINDDIGLLTTMPNRYAQMLKRTQNNLVYGILMNNTKIFDNKVLFSAQRKNTLASGTAVTLEAIRKMIYMIGIQRDAAGNQLALTPDLIIVPFGLGVDVKTILSSPTIQTTDNTQAINPYASMTVEVVEDVSLNNFVEDGQPIPWFMGVRNEIIQIDTLNGQREANIRRSEVPGKLGLHWDVFADFGVSVINPECICRNPGIAMKFE
ncbi:MAG: hypothetical protein Q4G33_05995 [bacterium]|nr:hypothetical protein [bacterium]